MTPIQIIEILFRVNRPVAIFMLAGMALLACASIVLSWGDDLYSTLYLAGAILGFSFALSIIVYIINDPRIRAFLGWVFAGSLVLLQAGFIGSVLRMPPGMPVPYCYVRMVTTPPNECENIVAPPQPVQLPRDSAIRWVPGGPDRLWLAQGPEFMDPKGQIFLNLPPNTPLGARDMLQEDLAAEGWQVESGGILKRDVDSPEVRFYHPDDAEAALRAAEWLKQQRPDAPVYLRDYSKTGVLAPDGVVEMWVPR